MSAGEAVRELLGRAVRAGAAPGLAAGWCRIDGGNPEIVVVGRADTRPGAALTQGHRFDLASLTKPLVTAPLVMLLARHGELMLETAVAHVIPELDGTAVGGRRMRHLLTHTSGLPAWAPLYALAASSAREDVLKAIAGLEVREVTGDVVYSCPGFILLGLVLERVAGTTIDILHRRLVLEPLGLEGELGFRPGRDVKVVAGAHTAAAERRLVADLGIDPSLIPQVAHGLPDDGNARFLDGVAGNAGLFGTVRGVLELARGLSVPGRLLSKAEIETMQRDHTPTMAASRGLGWQIASSIDSSAGPALDRASVGHNGFSGASVWIDRRRGVAVTLLTNRNHPGQRNNDLHPLRRRLHSLIVDSL